MSNKCGICGSDQNVMNDVFGSDSPVCLGCTSRASQLLVKLAPRKRIDLSAEAAKTLYKKAFEHLKLAA